MKKLISILLALAMSLSLLATVSALDSEAYVDSNYSFSLAQDVAEDLRDLNLFKGVSAADFDLDRAPTRVEALVMLVRLLGKENAALNGNFSHPFTDVPEWADKYVGYAYSNGITKGISATKFGTDNATSAMYFTFVLRALGYSDGSGKDFTWDNPYQLAMDTQIYTVNVDIKNFMRSDVVTISYAALSAYLNNSSQTLADKLVTDGVFTSDTFNTVYDKLKVTSPEENFIFNYFLRNFIFTYGKLETISEGNISIDAYNVAFYSEDANFSYILSYIPSTGVLSVTEEFYGNADSSYVSASLYFAGMGTAYDSAKVLLGIDDNGTQIIAAAFVDPQSYTYRAPIEFYSWNPGQTTSETYTRESCAELTSDILSDIIETTNVLLSDYYIGFTMTDMGYTAYFKQA